MSTNGPGLVCVDCCCRLGRLRRRRVDAERICSPQVLPTLGIFFEPVHRHGDVAEEKKVSEKLKAREDVAEEKKLVRNYKHAGTWQRKKS
jgi:hypothetical protein